MKKTKLLMPIIGVGSLAATIAPVTILTSCSKGIGASEQDIKFLEKINSYMTYTDDLVSPHKAITLLKDCGIDVLGFQLSSSQLEICFDSSVKRFIIMNGDKIVAQPTDYKMESTTTVFKFTSTYDANSKYGQYLLDNFTWTNPAKQFDVVGSIDVGNNAHIKNMHFQPKTNETSNKYLVRTFCEYIGFETGDNMVYHMGESNNIDVYGSGTDKCKFIEVGKTAYLYAERTTFSLIKMDRIDSASVDVFEAGKEVKAGKTFEEDCVTAFIGKDIEGAESEKTYVHEIKTLAEFNTALATGLVSFFKLTDDLVIDENITDPAKALVVKDTEIIIDLAGHSIVDNSKIPVTSGNGQAVFTIEATTATTSVVLINSDRRTGEVQLNNGHNIWVKGLEDATFAKGKTATLYLEGVNITHKVGDQKKTAAIKLGIRNGVAHHDSTGFQWSKLVMYGGVITATTTNDTDEAVGVFLNSDSYAQINYGSIYSDTFCIRTDGDYLGSTIDAVNATLKMTKDTNEEAACIYLPRGKLNTTNGTYEGRCCISIMGGEVNIAGGYFLATGDHNDIGVTNAGKTDGSVICMGVGSQWAYSKNPSLTIHNASMQSKHSYILQVTRNTAIDQFFEVDFYGGNYYYATDPTIEGETDYNGIRIAKDVQDWCRVNQYAGSWVKVETE